MAEKEINILENAIDDAHSALVLSDPHQDDNPLVYVNEAFEDSTGYDKSEVLGRNCRFLQGEETDPETVAQVREAVEKEESVTVEIRNYRKDGTMFWNKLSVTPVYDEENSLVRFLGTQIDITNRKQNEQKLTEQRDNLELLNQVLRHDIRNKLQIIQGRTGLVEGNVDKSEQEQINIIQENTKKAIELTNTARNLSETMLSSKADVEPVSLSQHIDTMINSVGSEFDDTIITIEDPIPDSIVLGNALLEAVFWNLVQNAVVHNDKEMPEIQLSITVADETVTLAFADNGPGIPDNQKEEVFGKGDKGLDSPGTGIGLYLVRTLVDQYGGDVWVEDNEPDGSVFVVELPKADAEQD